MDQENNSLDSSLNLLKQTEPNLDEFLDMSSNAEDTTLPANASVVRPWRELPFGVLADLVNSTTIETDEEQKARIHKFVTTYYQVFNVDDMKKKFPKFPEHYYDYLSLAAQNRFDALVKEEKKKWEIDRVDVSENFM